MNIILFISDTFRHDNLSCYGPAYAQTPRLNQFAQESFLFENFQAGSFPTLPNRMDIMSGRFSFIDRQWSPLPSDIVTLQQILSASGVPAMLIADNPHLVEKGYHFERGFDAWEWIRGQETDRWRIKPPNSNFPQGPPTRRGKILETYLSNTSWWTGETDRFVPRTVSKACQWLEEYHDLDQFFLWLDLFDPHEPWDASRNYIELYDPDYAGPEVVFLESCIWKDYYTADQMAGVRAMYLAEVSMLDHYFGVLLDKVEELGLAENTAVIFASDHGYLIGEHETLGKSLYMHPVGGHGWEAVPMWSEIRKIPLMIRLPGQAEGRRIHAMVQPPDLMPTILEMAGLVSSATSETESILFPQKKAVPKASEWGIDLSNIHGKSLVPLLSGETDKHRDLAVSSNTLLQHSPLIARSSITTEEGWVLHYAGAYEEPARDVGMGPIKAVNLENAILPAEPMLFNLSDDPDESNDVIQQNEGLAEDIHQAYVNWLKEVGTPEEHIAGRQNLRVPG